jgi:hypothetical protein
MDSLAHQRGALNAEGRTPKLKILSNWLFVMIDEENDSR